MKVTLRIHSQLKRKLVGKARDALAATMSQGAEKAVEMLSKVADSHLHHTSKIYKALLPESVTATATSLKIKLEGIGEDIETGYPARDMKPALLASPNAKTGAKGGRYVDVPFRHALDENATRFQGMPSEIKARVQASVRSERIAASAEGRPERNPLRVTGKMPATNPKHETSIHSDMIKTARQTGSRTSSTYQTIRRVSSNSDSKAWWHPGYQGLHAIRQVKQKLLSAMRVIFKRELGRRGLKTK